MEIIKFLSFLKPNKRWKILTYFFLIVAIGISAPYLWGYYKYQAAIARAKVVGFTFDVEEIIPPEVPAHQNASSDFDAIGAQIYTIMGNSPPSLEVAKDIVSVTKTLNAEDIQKLEKDYPALQFSLKALFTALEKEHARYDFQYHLHSLYEMPVPNLYERQLTHNALLIDLLLKINDKNYREAYQTLTAMLRYDRLVMDEVNHVIGFINYTFDAFQLINAHQAPDATQIQAIINEINQYQINQEFQEHLKFELLKNFKIFEDFINGTNENVYVYFTSREFDENVAVLRAIFGDWVGNRNDWVIFMNRYLLRFNTRINQAFLMDDYSNIFPLADQPYYKVVDDLKTSIPDWATYANQHRSGWTHAFYFRDRNQAQLDIMKLAMIIEDYHHKETHYPESLQELTPAYIEELPIDPFSGKPYQYRLNDEHYLIYSYCRNMEDDGGKPSGSVDGEWVWQDIVWTRKFD